jgi:hypothetical protein
MSLGAETPFHTTTKKAGLLNFDPCELQHVVTLFELEKMTCPSTRCQN